MTFNHEITGSECKDRAGRYIFKVTGRTLKLTRISDPCIIRRTIFSHRLTKIG
ncbi:MAG TPA: hypothetical protein VNA28_06740 [Solirubrobacteraceae bacterium]|nr:hypothetical protein [Solirubrobacteraceae bacterium]